MSGHASMMPRSSPQAKGRTARFYPVYKEIEPATSPGRGQPTPSDPCRYQQCTGRSGRGSSGMGPGCDEDVPVFAGLQHRPPWGLAQYFEGQPRPDQYAQPAGWALTPPHQPHRCHGHASVEDSRGAAVAQQVRAQPQCEVGEGPGHEPGPSGLWGQARCPAQNPDQHDPGRIAQPVLHAQVHSHRRPPAPGLGVGQAGLPIECRPPGAVFQMALA